MTTSLPWHPLFSSKPQTLRRFAAPVRHRLPMPVRAFRRSDFDGFAKRMASGDAWRDAWRSANDGFELLIFEAKKTAERINRQYAVSRRFSEAVGSAGDWAREVDREFEIGRRWRTVTLDFGRNWPRYRKQLNDFLDTPLGRSFAEAQVKPDGRCCYDMILEVLRGREDRGWSIVWEEKGRKYNLERRSNGAGRFLLCSVRDLEAKRFCLVFPEGKGLTGGWNILAEKLREVGVVPTGGSKNPVSFEALKKEKEPKPRIYAEVANSKTGRLGDKVWLELGQRVKPERLEQLDHCLVGRWENGAIPPPELDFLKNWAGQVWLLRGKLNISVLGRGLLLFEFELLSEAERVLVRGMRRVKDNALFLEKWHPEVGCFCNKVSAKEAWVRVVGLPLHLWSREVFKLIGDGCGGFIVVDDKTDIMAEMQWARLLVKVVGRGFPTSVQIVVGSGCFSVQLWWETPPWFSQVVPAGCVNGKGVTGEEEDAGSGSRGGCRGRVLEKEAQSKEQAIDGADSIGSRGHATGTAVKRGGFFNGSEDLNGGPVLGEAQFRSGLGEESIKSAIEEAQKVGPLSRPVMLKGWLMGCEERPFYIKGSFTGCEGLPDLGFGSKLEGFKGVRARSLSEVAEMGEAEEMSRGEDAGVVCFPGGDRRASEAFPTSARAPLIDEVLRAEASRYEPYSAVFGGERDFISSSPSSGCDRALVVGDVSGLDVAAEGASNQAPLRAVLSDGNLWVMDSEGEKSIVDKPEADEEMQDREDPSSMWDESNLLKFSKALGFATEGVEGEILKLLLRLKTRRDQGKKKGLLGLFRFDREVKKLEWSVNYDGKTRKKGVVRSLGVGRFLEWGALNARGAAGGVVVYWDSRVLELLGMEVGLFSISCRFKNCEDGFRWIFSGVYGPTMKRNRELLWEELGNIRGLWNDPWCIGGDFNMIRFPNERRRGGRLSPSMRRFSEVIDDLDLRDLPLQGGPFTWSGGLNNQTMSRLDRFLVSEDWESHFNGVVQSTLPRPVSDHFPILLDGGGVRRGPVPFRFENMWLKEEGFKDLLKGWWQGLRFSGSFSFILAEKLKALKAILKSWNKLVFGKVGVNKRLALDKVDFWDSQEKMRTLSLEELEARKEAKGDFEK
ncbi:hypothetical protein VitviT2T_024196 [Vitis vinifera]|uniref:DUF4283 domain-containing protein n=1 Tax=Vitis vinifera TaxID=29760 RepID=A0ABY9DF90_VITVI|nr:hypothetical protein VitviT2T_024196 [Vitis vinifera]